VVGRIDAGAELVFTGDVLGMVSPGSEYISIPVPPSDIDIPAWIESIQRLRALPRGLRAVLTHGGERPLGGHLDRFVARMNEELPLLGELVEVAETDSPAADARYPGLPAAAREGGRARRPTGGGASGEGVPGHEPRGYLGGEARGTVRPPTPLEERAPGTRRGARPRATPRARRMPGARATGAYRLDMPA
jgi:hypothetical protein